jgi:hypothetical protein
VNTRQQEMEQRKKKQERGKAPHRIIKDRGREKID